MIYRVVFLLCISLLNLEAPALGTAERPITKILLEKSKRKLSLLSQGQALHTYSVALGGQPVGHKTQEGDNKTPEGTYTIDWRNPNSHYHKSLHISYPNAADKVQARKRGVSPGGDIFIHGIGSHFGSLGQSHTLYDWTLGCIAVTNEEIDEIWTLVKNGTPIEIVP